MKAAIVMLLGDEPEERLSEIMSLAETAGYKVDQVFTQKGRASRKYVVRKGKVSEIREYVAEHNPEVVVFENLLTSRQTLALEDTLGVPVIDRFDLILNVFEIHAKSREATLQIELVRLKRRMPYIKMYLSRRVRTEHPGFGGSGEFIIHSTLTTIHRRIKSIERSLKGFERRADQQRKRRKKVGFVVSLAGYTNVGKTSLLYALTGVKKPVRDELFTTLRTKTASFTFNRTKYMVCDTIGFIRNIPLQLIHAFNATLQDIASSDLILIVHDSSLDDSSFFRHQEICEDALISIGANETLWLNVENKIDTGSRRLKDSVAVSAKTGAGVEFLKHEIERMLSHD
ncbi:MAG TPA: GTPase HflX [Euryarchaeota archaeon]|nr:GTPase HflX [Euryarchaeota archaeon]